MHSFRTRIPYGADFSVDTRGLVLGMLAPGLGIAQIIGARVIVLAWEGRPETHSPLAQLSPTVHKLPSLQGPAVGGKLHPVSGSQVSAVQGFASVHTSCSPDRHSPPPQISPVVQRFPSSHGRVFGSATHPFSAEQESSVQGLPSVQSTALPPPHALAPHTVPSVQGFPSSQAIAFGVITHPISGSQLSSVHRFPSSQFTHSPGVHDGFL